MIGYVPVSLLHETSTKISDRSEAHHLSTLMYASMWWSLMQFPFTMMRHSSGSVWSVRTALYWPHSISCLLAVDRQLEPSEIVTLVCLSNHASREFASCSG
jgi:hypothetical protein